MWMGGLSGRRSGRAHPARNSPPDLVPVVSGVALAGGQGDGHGDAAAARRSRPAGLRFVVDNTNPTRAERQVYIRAAKGAGFRVVGYYFRSRVEDCMRRNKQRPDARQVPLKGLLGTAGRMELPSVDEGFDELHYV